MLTVKAYVPVRHSRKLKDWTEKNNKIGMYDYQTINGQRCYVRVFAASLSELFDMAREIGRWVDAGWQYEKGYVHGHPETLAELGLSDDDS